VNQDDYNFLVDIGKLSAPLITSATHSCVKLIFEPAADKSRKIEYRLTFGKVGENTWRTVNANIASQTVTGLDADTVYEFRVAAKYDGGKWGSQSDPVRVKTKQSAKGECSPYPYPYIRLKRR